jgi:hypothetical protein
MPGRKKYELAIGIACSDCHNSKTALSVSESFEVGRTEFAHFRQAGAPGSND